MNTPRLPIVCHNETLNEILDELSRSLPSLLFLGVLGAKSDHFF